MAINACRPAGCLAGLCRVEYVNVQRLTRACGSIISVRARILLVLRSITGPSIFLLLPELDGMISISPKVKAGRHMLGSHAG